MFFILLPVEYTYSLGWVNKCGTKISYSCTVPVSSTVKVLDTVDFVSTLRNVFFTNYAKYSHQQKTFRFSSGFNILTLKTIDIMVCVNNHSLKWDVRINASPSWETVILMNLNSDILDCRYTCLISIRFTAEKLSAITDEQAFEAWQQKHQILTSHHWQASHQIGVTWGKKTSTTKPYNCSYHV